MTRTFWTILAALGSAALLGGAFIFQAFGYAPCELCLWQRWPHAAAIVLGAVAVALPQRVWLWLGALAAATTSGIGVYHTGVERKWWPGPSTCTGGGDSLSGLSGASLLSVDEGPRLIMCDQVSWELFGVSMASWNAIFSAVLVVLWIRAIIADKHALPRG